ncbi:MAG: HutP family protein [Sporomusaceae bacterium]|nr:HutP family protein [Sporomusaceae bacterium]
MTESSTHVARAALRLALSQSREEEQQLRAMYGKEQILVTAVDFGGDFVPLMKKIIERAAVAAQRQGLVPANHVGEGAVAGATKAALEQVSAKALGMSVGGKIGLARYGEHLCVALFLAVGVLNLNEVAVGLAHRSLADIS